MMWRYRFACLSFLVFALSLSIRLPFAFHPSVVHIYEAEYLDLARYFAKEGRGRSCLNIGMESWAEESQPLLLPMKIGGLLNLVARFHSEPEKMLSDARSWRIARTANAVVGSLAVTVWFLVMISLTGSIFLSILFAAILATNWALVQNSAMNMPEQWLLLLIGLSFWACCCERKSIGTTILAALMLSFLLFSGGKSWFEALTLALYLPLPFWFLFITLAWIAGNKPLVRSFLVLIAIGEFAPILFLLHALLFSRIVLIAPQVTELLKVSALFLIAPLVVAMPFAFVLWHFRSGWENENAVNAVWAGFGGAASAIAFYARPEGILTALALPLLCTKKLQRLTALLSWLLGLSWSLLILSVGDILPARGWFSEIFRALDFPLFTIASEVLAKILRLSLYLVQELGLLWFVAPLALWSQRRKSNIALSSPAKVALFMGLLFLIVHSIVWSKPAEARSVLVPLVPFAFGLLLLWREFLFAEKPSFRQLGLFAVITSSVLLMNGWKLFSTWRSEPQWQPEAIELAARMTEAMVNQDPMEASKRGCGVVSNMTWLISLYSHRLLTLMPLLDTQERLKIFVKRHNPEAFVFLLYGRTPQEAIASEPTSKVWFVWSDGNLKLRNEWMSSLELVDWKSFKNQSGVNIVAMVVTK